MNNLPEVQLKQVCEIIHNTNFTAKKQGILGQLCSVPKVEGDSLGTSLKNPNKLIMTRASGIIVLLYTPSLVAFLCFLELLFQAERQFLPRSSRGTSPPF